MSLHPPHCDKLLIKSSLAMFTDLIVLILTLVGLLMTPGRSQLWRLLLGDGVLYFLVAFLANTLPAVFLLLNLNPVMNVVRISHPALDSDSDRGMRSKRACC